MASSSILERGFAAVLLEFWPYTIIGLFVLFALYSSFLHHPLAHIPGTFLAKLSPIPLWRLTYNGIEASTLTAEHQKKGPVIRIAPNEVSISDGAALAPIYIAKGGYKKSEKYGAPKFSNALF